MSRAVGLPASEALARAVPPSATPEVAAGSVVACRAVPVRMSRARNAGAQHMEHVTESLREALTIAQSLARKHVRRAAVLIDVHEGRIRVRLSEEN
jgi:hypothetical protein